jgi:hypothetical protein
MTYFPMASVFRLSGTGSGAAPTATAAVASQLTPCAAKNYIVETVTLDLRDIDQTTKPKVSEEYTFLGNKVYSVTLETYSNDKVKKPPFIRKNTQTLPANCSPAGFRLDSHIDQTDVSEYKIFFGNLNQAQYFASLLHNALTVGPPTFTDESVK